MKRIMALILAVIMCMAIFVGCSCSESASENTEASRFMCLGKTESIPSNYGNLIRYIVDKKNWCCVYIF